MRARQLPRLWLMTDERSGDALFDIVARLPGGAGIVFRHHATPAVERRALFDRVRRIARARGLVLVLAGSARQAAAWRADGVHKRAMQRVTRPLLRTAAVHDAREGVAARRAGADLAFVSPVYATRSHPGARALGRVRFAALARSVGVPVIALGGVDARRGRALHDVHGWAGIDAFAAPASSRHR